MRKDSFYFSEKNKSCNDSCGFYNDFLKSRYRSSIIAFVRAGKISWHVLICPAGLKSWRPIPHNRGEINKKSDLVARAVRCEPHTTTPSALMFLLCVTNERSCFDLIWLKDGSKVVINVVLTNKIEETLTYIDNNSKSI